VVPFLYAFRLISAIVVSSMCTTCPPIPPLPNYGGMERKVKIVKFLNVKFSEFICYFPTSAKIFSWIICPDILQHSEVFHSFIQSRTKTRYTTEKQIRPTLRLGMLSAQWLLICGILCSGTIDKWNLSTVNNGCVTNGLIDFWLRDCIYD
jgi:hypothetical protein